MSLKQGPRTVMAKDVAVRRYGGGSLSLGDAIDLYDDWCEPDCIISDGPYGLGKFPGEPHDTSGLTVWYAPHAAAWARRAKPGTTLWFWNSELGWAHSHQALLMHDWRYEEAVIWNKGIAHIAGNVNSKTIRGLPVVTEIAVRYTRAWTLPSDDGSKLPLKMWLRSEWSRSGLPFHEANRACGVANAATRKYLTTCHLWYFPPGEAVEAMAAWCAKRGKETTRPYFSIDGVRSVSAAEWDLMRAKWYHRHGLTNVWDCAPVHGNERVRAPSGKGYLHANQKPLSLLERQIELCTDPNDVVWEPFGGLCSASVAAVRLGRRFHAAELHHEYFEASDNRLKAITSSTASGAA